MTKGKPIRDGSGKGNRANKGRGGCKNPRGRGRKQFMTIIAWLSKAGQTGKALVKCDFCNCYIVKQVYLLSKHHFCNTKCNKNYILINKNPTLKSVLKLKVNNSLVEVDYYNIT